MLLILRKNSFLMVSPSKKDNMLAKMPKIKSKELIILRCLLLSNPMQKVVETRCHFSLMEASYQTTFKLQRKKQTCLKNKPRNLVWPLRLKKIIIRKVICRPKQTLASRMRFPRARPFRLRRYKFNRSLYSQLRQIMVIRAMDNKKKHQPLLMLPSKKGFRRRWNNQRLQ